LPGHGRSAPWAGTDYHSDATAVAAALLRGPTHIIGHSFGATVALRLAVERPDLVSRVTLIEPVMFAATIGTAAHGAYQVAMEPFVAAWDVQDRTAATQAFLDMWGDGRAWGDLSDRQRATVMAQIHLIPAAASTIEHDIHGILARLGDVTCPVDLIEGGDSQAIMPAILSGLAARMPHARRYTIAGAGHMVPLTHVDAVALVL
jgi:lipase